MKMFRVEFKVGSNHLGDLLALLHGRAEDLDVSLIEDVPHNKNVRRKTNKAQPKIRRQQGVNNVLIEAMQKSPDRGISSAEARQLLRDLGFSADSYYGAKYNMVKQGIVHFRNGKMTLVK